MICLTRCGMLGMCYAREVAYWAYEMLGMWWCWGCGMFEMWDVQDAGWWECGMFVMWNVWGVGCSGFGVWHVGSWFTKFQDISAISLRTTNLWPHMSLVMTNKFENAFSYQKLIPTEFFNITNFAVLLHFWIT